MQDRYVRSVNCGLVISYSVRWISEVVIMEGEQPEDGEILLVIDASEQYSCYTECVSTKQEARLPEHKL